MAMVSCGSSRTWTPCLGSRGGDEDGSSGCALTLYIPWLRCSSKALQPFLGIVFGWVVGAKSWQLGTATRSEFALIPAGSASAHFIKVTQRVPVRIAVESPDGLLKPGMM